MCVVPQKLLSESLPAQIRLRDVIKIKKRYVSEYIQIKSVVVPVYIDIGRGIFKVGKVSFYPCDIAVICLL